MTLDEAWIRSLPKAVCHVHLEGALPGDALVHLVTRAGGDPRFPEPEDVRDYWSFDDELRSRAGFLERWAWKTAFLRDAEAFTYAARAAAESLRDEGVVYAEWLVAASDVAHHGLSARTVLEAVAEGLAQVDELDSRLILDVVAEAGAGPALESLESAIGVAGLVGVHIGAHAGTDPQTMVGVVEHARAAALQVSVRMDDETPELLDLWAPDRVVGLARVGRASALWERFLSERRPLLFTPRADIALGDATLHPLEHAMESGQLASVQPDAWQLVGGGVVEELARLRAAGCSRDAIRALLQASIASAFLPYRERRAQLGDCLAHEAWFEDV